MSVNSPENHSEKTLENETPVTKPVPTNWKQPEPINVRVFPFATGEAGSPPATLAGDQLTVLFDNGLTFNLQEKGAPLQGVGVAAFTAVHHAVEGKSVLCFRSQVRGALFKTGAARALITLNLGGAVATLEFPAFQECSGNFFHTVEFTPPFSPEQTDRQSPETTYVGVLTVFLERPDTGCSALLTIDSLDVETVFEFPIAPAVPARA